MMLKEVTKVSPQVSKNITVPVSGSPKMSNIMQSIANSLPPHLSPVKITFTKPALQNTNATTQKVNGEIHQCPRRSPVSSLATLNSKISQKFVQVIIVTTSASSNFVPNILSKSHSAAISKLGSTSILTPPTQKQTVVFSASTCPSANASAVAVTTVVSSTPSVVMSTVATCMWLI